MKNLNLSTKDFDYLKGLLEKDAEEIAFDVSFFEQLDINPKEFIDERISLCKEFDVDFWDCVSTNCSDYHTKQLRALYAGENIRTCIENYETPSQGELAKNFLKIIMKNRNKKNETT